MKSHLVRMQSYVLLSVWAVLYIVGVQGQEYALDRQSTCGQTLAVYDSKLTLTARSNVAPANPPLECIVYLQSAYQVADGRYRLQIVIEQLQIEDCNVYLTLFNGWGVSGNYLRNLGCSSSTTDIIYTTGREATVKFSRPQILYQTAYAITLTIQTYADNNDIATAVGVDTLTTGAIIGIVVGILALIAVGILFCWCCYTGRLQEFIGISGDTNTQYVAGSVDSGLEKASTTSSNQALRNGINYQDPVLWSSITGDGEAKFFRAGVPRRVPGRTEAISDNQKNQIVEMRNKPTPPQIERETANYVNSDSTAQNRTTARDSHAYEPYNYANDLKESVHFRKRQEDAQGSNRSRGSRRSRNSMEGGGDAGKEPKVKKETTIDDPGGMTTEDEGDTKRKRGSGFFDNPDPEGYLYDYNNVATLSGEESEKQSASGNAVKANTDLNRFDSTELHSEADVETIANPMHINAGVRASIPDLSTQTATSTHSPHSKKRSGTSPKSHRHPKGHDPDPMALPPEAFDPVFTTPTSQEQYPGEFHPLQQPAYGMPPMFVPYGMFPISGMVPGAQTYAYAYQTAPPPGAPPVANQGAYFVQSVPTADGNMQNTAFMMQSTHTPKRHETKSKGGDRGHKHPGAPSYTSTPGDSPRPRRDPSHSSPDMSLIAAGAVPPDPGSGQRSMAMKSFADPDTGVQTTQVLWTDTIPDPSDPQPGDSSQVTRKTITRVTTRSGNSDLPAQSSLLLDYPDPNPAFLTPSSVPQPAIAAATTPNTSNVNYYLGQGREPLRAPDIIHEAPSRSRAIRDRISFGDSFA